jgi:hypothetical protein
MIFIMRMMQMPVGQYERERGAGKSLFMYFELSDSATTFFNEFLQKSHLHNSRGRGGPRPSLFKISHFPCFWRDRGHADRPDTGILKMDQNTRNYSFFSLYIKFELSI